MLVVELNLMTDCNIAKDDIKDVIEVLDNAFIGFADYKANETHEQLIEKANSYSPEGYEFTTKNGYYGFWKVEDVE